MAIRVAINGFGRIGRLVFRVLQDRGDFEVVAINELADEASVAHLLKYDSVHGRFAGEVEHAEGEIRVDGRSVKVTAERDPVALPWGDLGVDFCVEATGVFKSREACMKHVQAGARRVLLTVPPSDAVDAMVVMGVNEDVLRPEHQVLSAASCTTNCLAPMAKVVHDAFGIEKGLMTTVHAYTNDQRIADQFHRDLRRGRAGAVNIIPTTTGAARAVGQVIPELSGKMDGYALRVPVPAGSAVDLSLTLAKSTTADEVNATLKAAAEGAMRGVLAYTEDPIVSQDVVGDPHSSIVDGRCTMVMDGTFAKLVSWYDNEWGYSHRVADLMAKAVSLGS